MIDVPKNIGKGEGGGNLPKLGKVLEEVVKELNSLNERVDRLENNNGED